MWEIPILGGYAFSQTTNTSEITLSEMADSTNASRRGRAMFTDSVAPAEWSFDTYVRPFTSGTAGALTHGAIEEVLWANFVADATVTPGVAPALPTYTPAANAAFAGSRSPIVRTGTTNMDVTFDNSNTLTLGTFDLVFVLGANNAPDANYELDGDTAIYRLNSCSINEVSITFDIDGIATLSWSGMGSRVREELAAFDASAAIRTAVDSTNTFIRNKLTQVALVRNSDAKAYAITLTGGTITFTNNLDYLTPEVLGRVNSPLGHITGARTIGGSMTAYLDNKTNGSMDLFEDVAAATNAVRNSFSVKFYVGGKDPAGDRPRGPGIEFSFPNVHLTVPTHDNADVISLSVDFSALPTSISSANEVDAIRYVGVAPA
jgi:hypothetical protein